jgi:hypothetical protein
MLEFVIVVDDYFTHSITDMYILTSLTQKMFKQLCKQVIPAHGIWNEKIVGW